MGSAALRHQTPGIAPMRPEAPNAGFGAEVTGVDLRSIDDAAFAVIRQAWIDHQVLLFRGQMLNHLDLIAFSRRFGELEHALVQETASASSPGCRRSTSSPT